MDADANVARFLPAMAAKVPDQCAVRAPLGRDADGAIRYREQTFAELEASAQAVAAALAERGVGRGTRTLLMVRPGLDLIQICFALFKLGAIPVVIDPGMGMSHFLACVRRTKPAALVGIPLATGLSRICARTFRSLALRVTVGRRGPPRAAGRFEPVESATDELAAILFTSGSTGPPKGVRYEHGMFDGQVRLIRETYGIAPGEVDLPMLPIFALFNPALGMTTVVPEMNPSRPATVDPAKIVRAIHQNGVTNSFGSPVLWDRIASHCERTGERLPSLRRVLMAGAPATPGLLRRLGRLMPNGEIHTPYGATECLPVSTISAREILTTTWQRTERGAGTCVGRPVVEGAVQVIEIQDGLVTRSPEEGALPTGSIGEIVVTGPAVTKAYDGLPEATAAAKIEDPDGRIWHRMGDVGYFDAEGRLWFCGRKVERIVTAYGPLFTDQVEGIFNAHRDVLRTALIGLGEPPNQQPALVVETQPGAAVSEAELQALAAKHPVTQQINRFFFQRNFPVDVRHNAKIHRLTLQRQYSHQREP